ncbi:hypothetical protein [Lysinibacillus sp. RC79]|uniref:hypothetical protein n=1 Tax=Lysinibacillus sp. RC79 TaxID=3156296 RepID=UPI003517D8EC
MTGRKKSIKVFTIILLLLSLIIFLLTVFANKTMTDDVNSSYIKENSSDLVIPTKDSIISNGYPMNENGQTYGPNIGNIMQVEPDLMLVKDENGVLGYIYPPEGISSPSELDEYNKSFKKSTPIYLQDGETIIGTFYFN